MRLRRSSQVLPFTLSEIFTLLFFALALVLVFESHRRSQTERELDEQEAIKAALGPLGPQGTETLVRAILEAQGSVPNDFTELVRLVGEQSERRSVVEEKLRELGADSTWIVEASSGELLDSLWVSYDLKETMVEELALALGMSEEERRVAEQMAAAVSRSERESRDLRGQVEWCMGRIGSGLDHPPCWADESGRPEFAFRVEMRTQDVSVRRIWPSRRDAHAAEIPGMTALAGERLSYAEFSRRALPVFNWSEGQDPICRHFVVIVDSVDGGKEAFKDGLLTVERFFYKLLSN